MTEKNPAVFATLLACALGLAACARALKEPPPFPRLEGGGAKATPEEVDGLLARARLLYAVRNLEGVRRASRVFLEAARADPARSEGLVGAARTQVWLADHEPEAEARRRAATIAVQSAQWCLRVISEDPACLFWLGAGLGVQARERPSTALDALPRIEEAFRRAAERNPDLEEAGPDRALALFYLRAPGWPAGPGDPERGLAHARKAVDRFPDHPPNQLALAEALLAAGDPAAGRDHCRRALEEARKRSSGGDPDAGEWIQEAESRLAAIED